MRKYLQKIVPAFIAGSEFEQSATCSVRHSTFFSYATPIAVRRVVDGRVVIFISSERFSSTTSGQQNAIKQLARDWRLVSQERIEKLAREAAAQG